MAEGKTSFRRNQVTPLRLLNEETQYDKIHPSSSNFYYLRVGSWVELAGFDLRYIPLFGR